MPKMKTKKAAAKRFKVTASNKVVHQRTGMSHLLEHESADVKRNRRGTIELDKSNTKKIKKLLGI